MRKPCSGSRPCSQSFVMGWRSARHTSSAQIESGSSADDGQVFSPIAFTQGYLAQNLSRLAGIFSCADVGERIDAIEQVMRNFRTLRRTGLSRADFKLAVHCNRVAVDDFSMETPGDGQRQSGLPARRGTQHHDEERLATRHL